MSTIIQQRIESFYNFNQLIWLDQALSGGEIFIALDSMAPHATWPSIGSTYIKGDPNDLKISGTQFSVPINSLLNGTSSLCYSVFRSSTPRAGDGSLETPRFYATKKVDTSISTVYPTCNPNIKGMWKTKLIAGEWNLIWGDNLWTGFSRTGVFLIDPNTNIVLYELPFFNGIAEFNNPGSGAYDSSSYHKPLSFANIPPGTYKLAAHNGEHGNYGWSYARTIEVVAAPTFKPLIIRLSPMSTPEVTTQQFENAISAITINGGGKIIFDEGRYYLTRIISLPDYLTLEGDRAIVSPDDTLATAQKIFTPNGSFITIRGVTFEIPLHLNYFQYWFHSQNQNTTNFTLERCVFRRGLIGEWARPNFFLAYCTLDCCTANQLVGSCLVLGNLFRGWNGDAGASSWGAVDLCIAHNEFNGTARPWYCQPHRGCLYGCLAFGNRSINIDKNVNGNEHVGTEEGFVKATASNWTKLSETQYRLDNLTPVVGAEPFTSPPLINHGATAAESAGVRLALVKRYTNKMCEVRQVTAETNIINNGGGTYTVTYTIDRPFQSAVSASVTLEIAHGVVDCIYHNDVQKGGLGVSIILYQGFTHGNLFRDIISQNGNDAVWLAAHATAVKNTHQLNYFMDCEWRHAGSVRMDNNSNFNILSGCGMLSPTVSMFNQYIHLIDNSGPLNLFNPGTAVLRSSGTGNVFYDSAVWGRGSGRTLNSGFTLKTVIEDGSAVADT